MTARAGCRIKSVRHKGSQIRLMVFHKRDDTARARAEAIARIKSVIDGHIAGVGDISGIAFVVWSDDMSSTACLASTEKSRLPSVAMPEFVKNRLLLAKAEDWIRDW